MDQAARAALGGTRGICLDRPARLDDIGARLRGRTLALGFTPPAATEFYDEIEAGAHAEMRRLTARHGVRWSWSAFFPDEHQDVHDQVETIHAWASRRLDAVLVCTAGDLGAMQRVYAAAAARGTRMFQFNMPAELSTRRTLEALTTVGYDNAMQAGYRAGEYIARTVRGRGRLLLVWGLPGHWSTARFNGLQLALRHHPGLRLAGVQRGDYVRGKACEAVLARLRRAPDVDAIYGENDEMALGACDALAQTGRATWDGSGGVVVVGADGQLSGYESIAQGGLTATVDVAPAEHGRRAVEAVFWNAALGLAPRPVIDVPTRIVDRSNVALPLARARRAAELRLG